MEGFASRAGLGQHFGAGGGARRSLYGECACITGPSAESLGKWRTEKQELQDEYVRIRL